MKALTFICLLLSLGVSGFSQDLLISFAGTGSSTAIDNILVANLTQGTSLTLNGTDVLNLRGSLSTGEKDIDRFSEAFLNAYPNPSNGNFTVEFMAEATGYATLRIYNQLGNVVSEILLNLIKGNHTFHINGLNEGIYTLKICAGSYNYTSKLLSQQKGRSAVSISYSGIAEKETGKSKLKSIQSTIQMQYNTGDLLKFTCKSGNFTTVYTDVPAQSKTISFSFVDCHDGDNNYYPVVKIGNQVWMQKNLSTTKLADGTPIPEVTSAAEWGPLYTPAFCNYNNTRNADTINTYGRLYNWYTVKTEKLCPSGWHVPSDQEWTDLTTFIGGTGRGGGKLKEVGTLHWKDPNHEGTDEYGFTALPAGHRYANGPFVDLTTYAYWWTNRSEEDTLYARGRSTCYACSEVDDPIYGKKQGLSVRCIKD